jgi:hypothetical protein
LQEIAQFKTEIAKLKRELDQQRFTTEVLQKKLALKKLKRKRDKDREKRLANQPNTKLSGRLFILDL